MIKQLKKVNSRPDYVSEVYNTLLDAISDGSLAPGARLTQEEIAEQMSVSRSPVLQALRLLKKDGFVTDAPGRGVLVAPLDADWFRHLYDIRGALEELAVRLAAAKRASIDPQILAEGRAAVASDDVKRMIDADIAFHFAISEASANPLILESIRSYWGHLRRVMGPVLLNTPNRQSIWDDHEAIAEAIKAGDGEAAVRHLAAHNQTAKQAVIEQVTRLVAQ